MVYINLENNKLETTEFHNGDVLDFGKMPDDDVMSNFIKLADIELKESISFNYNFKGRSIDLLKKVIEYTISKEEYINPRILTNILFLIRPYNTLEDSFFQTDSIYVSNIEDFIDLKSETKSTLRKFNTKVVLYYLSCIKSLNKIDYNFMDKPVKLPKLVATTLSSIDMFTLAAMMSNMDEISSNGLMLVEDAIPVVVEMGAKLKMLNMYLNSIGQE